MTTEDTEALTHAWSVIHKMNVWRRLVILLL